MTLYDPTVWTNDSVPAINASNLNKMESGIESAHVELASQVAFGASTLAYASAIAGNLGAQASAVDVVVTAQASQAAAIATVAAGNAALATAFAGQSAAVGSNIAAVATITPLVQAHGSQLAQQATQLGALASTVAGHSTTLQSVATSIYELTATQAGLIDVVGDLVGVPTQLADIATQLPLIAAQATSVGAFRAGAPYLSRGGRGPVDLYDVDSNSPLVGTHGTARALGQAVVPAEDWLVSGFSVELIQPGVSASPFGSFAFGVLNSVGSVISYSIPTAVPSIGGVGAGTTVSVPAQPSGAVMQAGQAYQLVVVSNDAAHFSPLVQQTAGAHALWARGLIYDWAMPSGLNLASYGSRPLSQASSVIPAYGLPAVFVS